MLKLNILCIILRVKILINYKFNGYNYMDFLKMFYLPNWLLIQGYNGLGKFADAAA